MDPEKTGPQFRWLKESMSTTRDVPVWGDREGINRRITENEVRLERVDVADSDLSAEYGTAAPTHVTIRARWDDQGARPWAADEIGKGRNFPLSGEGGQGTLFTEPAMGTPVLSELYSTKNSRVAAMRGVGVMANIVEAMSGKAMEGSSSLSPHSAAMVSRLTGEEHEATNDIDFTEPEGQVRSLPLPSEMGDTGYDRSHDGRTHKTRMHKEWVSDEDLKAGTKRITEHMASMRGGGKTAPQEEEPPPPRSQQIPLWWGKGP